jgi:hypothetical protein
MKFNVFILEACTKNITADAAKTVNAYFNRH